MHEIRYGLTEGIDVSIYASPEFNAEQMQQIRDTSIYADPKFNLWQMREIKRGWRMK